VISDSYIFNTPNSHNNPNSSERSKLDCSHKMAWRLISTICDPQSNYRCQNLPHKLIGDVHYLLFLSKTTIDRAFTT
jgi:hypothetical protein